MNPMVTGDFSLTDHHNQPVTQDTYKGRWILAFFGFTHCKMVCPRALARLSEVVENLGSQANKLTPLYITVDPVRDSPKVMREFLANYPAFTGLTGTSQQVAKAKESFQVFARQRSEESGENYQIAHTALTYLLDPEGKFITHWSDAHDTKSLHVELAALLGD